MDIRTELARLPQPDPHAPSRILRRLEAASRQRSRRWAWALAMPMVGLAALALWALAPESPRSLPLDSDALSVAWSDQVQISGSGEGVASGTRQDLELHWVRGTLEIEVAPHQGNRVVVVTDEARVTVVGTVFSVTRDRLGVTVGVSRGQVSVACDDGWSGALVDHDTHTCLPTRPGLLLGRADALEDQGAPLALRLQALDRGLELAEQGSAVQAELWARRLPLRAELGQVDGALDDARAYLASGQPGRSEEVARFAAYLALAQRDCASARPFLELLAEHSDQDRRLLADCLAAGAPR